MNFIFRLCQTLIMLCMVGLLSACNSGPTSDNQNNQLSFSDTQQFVPVLSGKTTRGMVMIKNNTDRIIANIHYQSIVSGGSNLKDQVQLVDEDKCATLAPHEVCQLEFDVGVLAVGSQNSAVINASWQSIDEANKTLNRSVLIDYSVVLPQQISFANNLGYQRTGLAESIGYTVLYIVNPEESDYTLKNLTTPSSNSQISTQLADNGVNTTIANNSVVAIPIEFTAPNSTNRIGVKASVANTYSNQLTNIQQTIEFPPTTANGPILIYGVFPQINGESTLTANVNFYNAGNGTATIESIIAGSGLSLATGANACSSTSGSNTLAYGQSCTVYITVTQQYSGSGSVQLRYSGINGTTTVAPTASWFYAGGPLLALTTPLNSYSTYGPKTTTVTISNYNNYPVKINSLSAVSIVGATSLVPQDSNCVGQTLNVSNPSCTTSVTLSGNGQPKIVESATYYDSSGVQRTYTSTPLGYTNLYSAGTWNPVGTTESNGAGYAIYNIEPNAQAGGNIELAISPVNQQPYVVTCINTGTTGYTTGCFVVTYNGSVWQQVGQFINLSIVGGIGSLFTVHIKFNPVTNIPWIALYSNSDGNYLFYSYDATTNTWLANAAPTIPAATGTQTKGVKLATNCSSSMAFDNAGNLYFSYFNPSAAPYQVRAVKYSGGSWVTLGGNISTANGGPYCTSLAINPTTQQPWVAYFESTTICTSGSYTSCRAIVKSYDGISTWTGVGAVVYTSYAINIGIQQWPALALAFNPTTATPVLVGSSSATSPVGMYSAYSYNGTSWSLLGQASFAPQYSLANGARMPTLIYGPNASGPYFIVGLQNTCPSCGPSVSSYSSGSNTWSTYGPGLTTGWTVLNSSMTALIASAGFGLNGDLIVAYTSILSGLYSSPTTFVDIYNPS